MVAHSMPKPGGKPFPIMTSSGIPDTRGNLITYESEELEGIEWHAKRKLPIDIWWRDAGWYPCGDAWWNVGTWEPDPVRFPRGLKPMADAAHKAGMKLTVWWEPERVVPGTKLYTEHPDWLLGPDGAKLFDLSNKAAWNWLVNTIDKFITDQGIDMYRQDFNIDPTGIWKYTDAPDRVGITEIRQCEGMIALWDELKRRQPNMPFDNCAGGGRRNVVEMMRRGVALSKTDDAGGTASSQCQLMGLAPWIPYYGAGIGLTDDPYKLRSNMAPWSAFGFDCKDGTQNWDRIRLHLQRCHELAPNMLGDFYPMTPYSLDETLWAAWQFDRPEEGKGMVQAFRRTTSDVSSMTFKLRGLDAKARYKVQDIDSTTSEVKTGKELMENGLKVTIASKPGAAIVTYKKAEANKTNGRKSMDNDVIATPNRTAER
jgi:alpha-galactosidase